MIIMFYSHISPNLIILIYCMHLMFDLILSCLMIFLLICVLSHCNNVLFRCVLYHLSCHGTYFILPSLISSYVSKMYPIVCYILSNLALSYLIFNLSCALNGLILYHLIFSYILISSTIQSH